MALLDALQEKREDILAIAAQHGAFNIRIFGSVARRFVLLHPSRHSCLT